MSWFMCGWTLTTMWLMSERYYRVAWCSSVLSQFGWAWLAYCTQLWGMLALSAAMLLIALRALRKLETN